MSTKTKQKPTSFQEYEHESERFVGGFKEANPKAIVQYVRFSNKPKSQTKGGKARQRRGVIVAFIGMSGELRIGWSLFNINHESRTFSPNAGLRKAIERACTEGEYDFNKLYDSNDQRPNPEEVAEGAANWRRGVPQTIRRPILKVLERAKRYYFKEQ